MAANEEQLLRRFQASGSRDALRELLVVHQDRIYNACFQVLGRAEDAEDAAQEALLKLAGGARSARDADSFRGWIYRVSLRVALDLWRRREATRNRESRSAMNRPLQTPPLDDRERLALFEAMDGLDDRDRSLLLEHYFEKVPLADLGERRGVSAVAIWKRIDRAREKLKKTLLGAGFVAASARVGEALEATVPATAPAALVGEAILGKILAGGLAVGATKSSMIPIAVIAAMLLLAVGAGGYRILRMPAIASPGPIASRKAAEEGGSPHAKSASPPASVPSKTPDEPVNSKVNHALLEKLAEYKALYEAYMAEVRSGKPITIYFNDKGRELMKEAQPLVLADPATYLEFLRDPANEELLRPLINQALDKGERWMFKDLPAALTEGILDILKTGGSTLKAELLAWLRIVNEPPPAFDEQYARCLHDDDPRVQAGGIDALARGRPLDSITLEKVRTVFETSSDSRPRIAAVDAICRTNTPEVQGWLARQLEANRDPGLVQALARAAFWRASFLRAQDQSTFDPRELDRLAAGLGEAVHIQNDAFGFSLVVRASLYLPADRSVPILEAAIKAARTPGDKNAVETVLAKLRAGGSTPLELTKEFQRMATGVVQR